jgi:hypothetical protein
MLKRDSSNGKSTFPIDSQGQLKLGQLTKHKICSKQYNRMYTNFDSEGLLLIPSIKAHRQVAGVPSCAYFTQNCCRIESLWTGNICSMASFKRIVVLVVIGLIVEAKVGYSACPFSDSQIWLLAGNGTSLGSCTIAPGGPSTACDLYVKAGGLGYPQSTVGGSGCVVAPEYPKRMSFCWYNDRRYTLAAADRANFCTSSGYHNAAAQVCHALTRGMC